MAQMPEEGRKFGIVDKYWKDIMDEAIKDTHCLAATSQPNMLSRLNEANSLLEDIQQGLNAYLEKKRLFFARSAIRAVIIMIMPIVDHKAVRNGLYFAPELLHSSSNLHYMTCIA